MLDVLKAKGIPATFFVNTYAASDWLGPFGSTANQVRAVCLQRADWPACRASLGRNATQSTPAGCRQVQAVDPDAVTRTVCRLH